MKSIDAWIHGQGVESGREYLTGTIPPRCIVQVGTPAAFDSDETKCPDDAGQSLQNKVGEEFVVVMWIDPFPGETEALRILTEADRANEKFTNDSFDSGEHNV